MRSKFVSLLAAAFSLGFAQAASAADMPVKAPIVKAPVAVPYSWTGFYIGADVGAGWMRAPTYTFADPGNAAFASCGPCVTPYDPQTLSGSGNGSLLGGIYLGYNWQFAPMWLAGVEGDFTWTGIRQSVNGILTDTTAAPPGPVLNSNLNFETDVRWLASLRGRLGLIQNDWLFYATGGVAFADLRLSANASCPPPAVGGGCFFTSFTDSPFSKSIVRVGFVVGGGLEWQMPASHWRARAEYLYYGFDKTDSGSGLFLAEPGGTPLPCIATPTCSANYTFGHVNIQTARIGLGYTFP